MRNTTSVRAIIVFLLFIVIQNQGITQDLIKEIQVLTLANDSLKKANAQLNEALTSKLQIAYDSIAEIGLLHKSELSEINKSLRKLERDTAELYKLIKKLDKNNLSQLELRLKQKDDSLLLYSNTIKKLSIDIEELKRMGVIRENQKFEEGRQAAINQMIKIYTDTSFSKLLLSSTPESVKRDLLLAEGKEEEKIILINLQIYFESKRIIEARFNSQDVSNAIKQISLIPQDPLVSKLKEKIEKYGLRTEGLKTALNKILELDRKFIANDDYTQKVKFSDILAEISWYFRNYRFELGEYPFLSGIVLDVMKRKEVDANADIKDLLLKL